MRAVDGVDLTVGPQEIVAFLGPNGAGKTTTLDIVLGLTSPTSGHVRVHGGSPRSAVSAGRVSALLQTGGLLRDLTVRETVQMIASTFVEHAGVDEVLERAGLGRLARRRVSECSGGEQQRLRFALALLPDPDLLVPDEPTASMDFAVNRVFFGLDCAGCCATSRCPGPTASRRRPLAAEVQGCRSLMVTTFGRPGQPEAGTVRNYLSDAIGKTGASTRVEAARLAVTASPTSPGPTRPLREPRTRGRHPSP